MEQTKEIRIRIDMVLKNTSLKEEFFHFIAYMVKEYSCSEDEQKIEKLYMEQKLRKRFVGKNTKLFFSQSPAFSCANPHPSETDLLQHYYTQSGGNWMREEISSIFIEMIPKCPSLEEELFYNMAYIVQQFACPKDAKRIESFLNGRNNEYEFIGKKSRIALTKTTP